MKTSTGIAITIGTTLILCFLIVVGGWLEWYSITNAITWSGIILFLVIVGLIIYFLVVKLQKNQNIEKQEESQIDMKKAQENFTNLILDEYHEHLIISDSQTRSRGELYVINGKGLIDNEQFVGIINSKDIKKTQILLEPTRDEINEAIEGAVNPVYAKSKAIRRTTDEMGRTQDVMEETILPETQPKKEEDDDL